MPNDIAPMHQTQPNTLDEKIQQACSAGTLFQSLGLREAVGENGDYFRRDPKTGDKVICYKGLLVEERNNTIAVVFTKPGAEPNGVVSEMSGYSQKAIGAVLGESQQAVSDRVLAKTKRG